MAPRGARTPRSGQTAADGELRGSVGTHLLLGERQRYAGQMGVVRIRASTEQDVRRGVDHIGVSCVFFCHDGRGNFLLHKRSSACRDEQGTWDNGGGALEFGEDFEHAIRREVKEEYCAEALEVRFLAASNVLRQNGDIHTHWVALIFAVRVDPRQVAIGEPEKMDAIGWFTKDNLPSPLHSQLLRHFEHVKRAGLV